MWYSSFLIRLTACSTESASDMPRKYTGASIVAMPINTISVAARPSLPNLCLSRVWSG